MKIGLIDVDGHNFPNLALMKISAYHKKQGDSVEWYQPMFSGHCDKVYVSKVFSFTPDYEYIIDADVVSKGGTGYCIELVDGKEIYHKERDHQLPEDVEHMYPDYSIYNITDTAYGFLTRGCPRGCDFCHVKDKEGRKSYKVADLKEFWNGQKNIEILDPNILACREKQVLFEQIIESKARVNFNQGLDIRLIDGVTDLLSQIPTNDIHFAWDRIEDKEIVQPRFLEFRKKSTINSHHLQVYVLCGDKSKELLEDDMYRVQWLKDNGYAPYVMLYDKKHCSKTLRRFQRYVNNRFVFWSTEWQYYEGGRNDT